jgi:phosphoribosylformimino-5-aminoimidazole carboxamide ribotide isomerase
MKFRPCIDIHKGEVKQIVGSTLSEGDSTGAPVENFVSSKSTAEFASMYSKDKLTGGHVIMLGEGCESVAKDALQAYPNGLQIGGGINADNARQYLEAGASHIIVTSYVFHDGIIDMEKLQGLVDKVGKERIVIDLSCRKKPEDPSGSFFVVTNKWTKFTDYEVSPANLKNLAEYCDEFLVHGVDVEGKKSGIDEELVTLLGEHSPLPVCYAGGARSLDDLELVKRLGKGNVDITIGSALDIFGGDLSYDEVVTWSGSQK